jgi:BirA family biotin operon repressor/biotin-[acetyl-CoA-carboxylase] ligase
MSSGWVVLEEVGSTNDEARRLAEEGAPGGTVVVARRQSAGRGRHGRSWHSPAGTGLYLSYLHRSRLEAARLPGLTLDAAAVVADLCRAEGLAPEVKWPNDVLIRGKKIGGILCELVGGSPSPAVVPTLGAAVVIGVGLNLNDRMFPEELVDRATSLRLETGREADVEAWARVVATALGDAAAGFEARGLPDLARYLPYFRMVGKEVAVTQAGPPVLGIVVGVAEDGGLEVRRRSGEVVRVRSGEVSG